MTRKFERIITQCNPITLTFLLKITGYVFKTICLLILLIILGWVFFLHVIWQLFLITSEYLRAKLQVRRAVEVLNASLALSL